MSHREVDTFNWFTEWKSHNDSWVPKVIIGDVRKVIPLLPDNYVDCVVTSPPYWMQRDYEHPQQIGRESSPEEYTREIVKVFEMLKPKLKKTATVFLNVGYKYYNEELLLIPEMIALEMRKTGYMLKNKIIWYKPNAMPTPSRNRLNNMYEPVLVFIKKESKEFYYFNLEEVGEKPKTLQDFLSRITSVKPEDYLGLRVVDSLRQRQTREGRVVGVRYHGRKVYEVLVKWTDGELEYLPMGDLTKDYPEETTYTCPYCGKSLSNWDVVLSIANYEKIICPHCGKYYPSGVFPYPNITNNNRELVVSKELVVQEVEEKKYLTKAPKSSKYMIVERVISASPAGRLALTGEYLVVKRRWRVPQPLISFYLKYWRELRGVSIKEIDNFFNYKDTAGHWFRYDFGEWGKGGSLPRPSDWTRLKELLRFDDTYDSLLKEVILGFSTVKSRELKNPGDVWSIKLEQYPGAHFAIFPRELVEKSIKIGCPINGVVLDPFAGSGTVGEVAFKLRRKAMLIELKKEYVELIKNRCNMIDLYPREVY
ncbi:MAG: site-specific DNA-methyltransferase [Desulfurococcus sp.]|uniref:site-specific DNA-methyltransferase n=1 Tax=Desulfurococcus sp. TaxID=51678 RepID=UPI003181069B